MLTAAGEALVGPARQTLRDVDTARAAVAAVAGLEAGRLDLCALPTLAVDPVAPLTGAFRIAHPGVTVTLADAEGPGEVASLVVSGDAEVGITVEHAANDALRSVALGRQEMLVVLPPGSPARDTRALPAAELASRPIVTTPRGTSTRQLLDEAFASRAAHPADRRRHRAARSGAPARARRRGRLVAAAARRRERGERSARWWCRCSPR